MYINTPSFIAKKDVQSYPGIGKIAEAMQTLFLDRTGTKEERKKMVTFSYIKNYEFDRVIQMDLIGERQELCDKGLMPPLLIYPEGCTTNGTSVITFKKGSFVNEKCL